MRQKTGDITPVPRRRERRIADRSRPGTSAFSMQASSPPQSALPGSTNAFHARQHDDRQPVREIRCELDRSRAVLVGEEEIDEQEVVFFAANPCSRTHELGLANDLEGASQGVAERSMDLLGQLHSVLDEEDTHERLVDFERLLRGGGAEYIPYRCSFACSRVYAPTYRSASQTKGRLAPDRVSLTPYPVPRRSLPPQA